jgi:CheY-like chemotaxis protein
MTRVLVVDDSVVDRRLAGGLLEKQPDIEVHFASNGKEALEEFRRRVPDIVVTDLQMPEMNGLDLVGQIRSQYPLVPVILMTAHGSEDIAVQALAQGAASYVPKSNLARDLIDTLEHVLSIARAGRRHGRVVQCMTRCEMDFEIENDPALVPALVDMLQEQVSKVRLCDETGRIRVGIALEESLLNAVYHGNLELTSEEIRQASADLLSGPASNPIEQRRAMAPYAGRKVRVAASITPDEARFVISDDGPGFDPAKIPDPTDPNSLERQQGRGLNLIRSFMDEVRHNATGNEVTLVKRRETCSDESNGMDPGPGGS